MRVIIYFYFGKDRFFIPFIQLFGFLHASKNGIKNENLSYFL